MTLAKVSRAADGHWLVTFKYAHDLDASFQEHSDALAYYARMTAA